MNKLFKSKKFKYGSLSVTITVVFIAAIIALNLIITALDNKYNLKIDLTVSKEYTISEETDTALRVSLGERFESFKVTIYFLTQKDTISYLQHNKFNNDGQYYTRVRDIAEQYANKYPQNINVEYIDITQNPSFANKYKTESQNESLTINNIIIQGEHHFRILTFDAMYSTSDITGALYAFRAEAGMTAAILQSSFEEKQIIGFTSNHGEKWSETLQNIFETAGFEVIKIDLLQEEIDPRVKILVISNPLSDFIGLNEDIAVGKDEISKLTKYMSDPENYNSLMVFVNAETKELPSLQEYLWEYWGLNYKHNYKITDSKQSVPTGHDFYSIIGQYSSSENTSIGYTLHKIPSTAGIRSIFRNSVMLEVNKNLQSISIDTAVYASPSAVAVASDTQIIEGGGFPLLAVSYKMKYGENNAEKYKFVMLCGSTQFVDNNYLSNSYGNKDIISAAVRNMATERVIPDIDIKVFEKTPLTISNDMAKTLSILITVTLPALVIIAGVIVFVKRRHL